MNQRSKTHLDRARDLIARFTGLVSIEFGARCEIVRKINAVLELVEEELSDLRTERDEARTAAVREAKRSVEFYEKWQAAEYRAATAEADKAAVVGGL